MKRVPLETTYNFLGESLYDSIVERTVLREDSTDEGEASFDQLGSRRDSR